MEMKRIEMLSALQLGDSFQMNEGGARYQVLAILVKGPQSIFSGWVCKSTDVNAINAREFVVKGDRPVMNVVPLRYEQQ